MLNYNAPIGGNYSSIDSRVSPNKPNQMNDFYWLRKAIIESRKDQYFMPLADVTNMPKHFGKNIRVHEYVPLLDVRNANDMGIDAGGVEMDASKYKVKIPFLELEFDVEADATAAAAALNAVTSGLASKTGAATPWKVTVDDDKLIDGVWTEATTKVLAEAVLDKWGNGSLMVQQAGNLYGSSRDIGTIVGKMPFLDELGGRKNRVGFTRISREGEIHKFGIFYEFTQESLDFDSDSGLKDHLARELMNGAVQLTEAVLQKDLLTDAGTIVYAGAAKAHEDITGEDVIANQVVTVPRSEVTYADIQRLDQTLTDLRCPMQTKVITGSRYIDTKVIGAGRVMYIGSALVNTVKNMRDSFNDRIFIPVQHYADAGTILNGEIGSIDAFRIVQVPEMLHWAGEGAKVGVNPGYRATNGRYDVYPMMVVGDAAFTTIGFQSNGKTVNFSVKTKMPSENHSTQDPYGETGFSSMKWYYGTLILRPERLGVIKTVARV